jgi:hypothetical protein
LFNLVSDALTIRNLNKRVGLEVTTRSGRLPTTLALRDDPDLLRTHTRELRFGYETSERKPDFGYAGDPTTRISSGTSKSPQSRAVARQTRFPSRPGYQIIVPDPSQFTLPYLKEQLLLPRSSFLDYESAETLPKPLPCSYNDYNGKQVDGLKYGSVLIPEHLRKDYESFRKCMVSRRLAGRNNVGRALLSAGENLAQNIEIFRFQVTAVS